MPLVKLLREALSAASGDTQQLFLENYIAVRTDDSEITPAQLADPAEWAKLAPHLIEIWEENTRESIKHGNYGLEDLNDECGALFPPL
jgi:hypothetical protein